MMFLHVGKDKVIEKKDLICILDIESLKINGKINSIIEKLEQEKNIIDISENNRKTLILVQENEAIKGYISNISSTTLGKRS